MAKKHQHPGTEAGDDWRALKAASKQHRTDKQEWSKELLQDWANDNGVEMKIIADWQIRLSKGHKIIDIYPQRQKYHQIQPNNKRGGYKDLIAFVKNEFQYVQNQH